LDDGQTSDPSAALLSELETILKNFPEIPLDSYLSQLDSLDPTAYLALDNANDTLTRSQMLKAHNRNDFLAAEDDELRGLIDMQTWKYKRISELPLGTHLINSVWSYHRKHSPDGELIKYKACLCADGRQQKFGIDYFTSYAPVITWTTVRLVLLLSVLLNLHCQQIDFTQAFPQANIDVPVFL